MSVRDHKTKQADSESSIRDVDRVVKLFPVLPRIEVGTILVIL